MVKIYIRALKSYQMTVLSAPIGIIMYFGTNTPGHGHNVVGVINDTDNCHLK